MYSIGRVYSVKWYTTDTLDIAEVIGSLMDNLVSTTTASSISTNNSSSGDQNDTDISTQSTNTSSQLSITVNGLDNSSLEDVKQTWYDGFGWSTELLEDGSFHALCKGFTASECILFYRHMRVHCSIYITMCHFSSYRIYDR